MTRLEVVAMIKRLAKTFPDFGQWFHNHGQELVTTWSEVLERLSASDANVFVTGWIVGDVPFVAAYEREQIPQRIVQGCRAIADKRFVRSEARRLVRQGTRSVVSDERFVSGAEILRFAFRLKAEVLAGRMTEDERQAFIDERIARIAQE